MNGQPTGPEPRFARSRRALRSAIYEIDAVGDCLFVNEHWCALRRRRGPRRRSGRGWMELRPSRRPRAPGRGVDRGLGTRAASSRSSTAISGPTVPSSGSPGGRSRSATARATALGYLGTAVDITDRKRFEADSKPARSATDDGRLDRRHRLSHRPRRALHLPQPAWTVAHRTRGGRESGRLVPGRGHRGRSRGRGPGARAAARRHAGDGALFAPLLRAGRELRWADVAVRRVADVHDRTHRSPPGRCDRHHRAPTAERERRELAAILDCVGRRGDRQVARRERDDLEPRRRAGLRLQRRRDDRPARSTSSCRRATRASCPRSSSGCARASRIDNLETERVRKDGAGSTSRSPSRRSATPRGEVIGVSTIARDITEQRGRAAARRERAALRADPGPGCDLRLRRLLQASSTGPGSRPSAGPRPSCSPKPFIEIVHPDDRDAVDDEVAKLARAAVTSAEFKIRVATTDGRWVLDRVVGGRRIPTPASSTASGREISERDGDRAGARPPSAASSPTPSRSPGSAAGSSTRDRGARLVRAAVPQPRLRPQRPPPTPERALRARSTPTTARSAAAARARLDERRGEFELRLPRRPADGRVRDDRGRGPAVRRRRRLRRRIIGHEPRRHRRARRRAAQGRVLPARLPRAAHPADLDHRLHRAARRDRGGEPQRPGTPLHRGDRAQLAARAEPGRRPPAADQDHRRHLRDRARRGRPRRDRRGDRRGGAARRREGGGRAGRSSRRGAGRSPATRTACARWSRTSSRTRSSSRRRAAGSRSRSTSRAAEVAFEVTDTGIGITQEDLGRLFDRMYRAGEAERRHIQGTGLGLTIVKAIVDAHEGDDHRRRARTARARRSGSSCPRRPVPARRLGRAATRRARPRRGAPPRTATVAEADGSAPWSSSPTTSATSSTSSRSSSSAPAMR